MASSRGMPLSVRSSMTTPMGSCSPAEAIRSASGRVITESVTSDTVVGMSGSENAGVAPVVGPSSGSAGVGGFFVLDRFRDDFSPRGIGFAGSGSRSASGSTARNSFGRC